MGLFDFLTGKPTKEELMLTEFDGFMDDLNAHGGMDAIQTSIMLKPDEYAYLESPAKLYETRSVSEYTSGGRVGLRVAKGVYIGSGSSGRSKSHQELTAIDTGILVITTKRIVFSGSKENRIIPLEKIISIRQLADGIEVSSETRAKTMSFMVNPYIWIAVYELVSGTGNFGSIIKK